MRLNHLACQLYTLRDFCKTTADFTQTIQRVKSIGYAAVQISGVGPIPPDEIRRICAGEGIIICATHEPGGTIINEPQKVVDRLAALGTRFTAYPSPHVALNTLDEVITLAQGLDRAGAVLRAAGMVLTYHNHAREFAKFAGKTILEHLYERTDPLNVQGEIDTYWVAAGGHDPATWIRRLNQRLPLLHLKDYGVSADGQHGTIMEVGSGNLDWPSIIAAADTAGCQWFIVEQDTCPGDPFVSVEQSHRFLREHCT